MDNSMDINLDELHIGPEFDTPEEVDQTKTCIQQKSHVTVLKEEDILGFMENDIQSVTDKLSLSRDEATLLLSYFHWDVAKLCEKWSHEEKKVRDSVGLLERPVLESPPIFESKSYDREFFCGACSQSHPTENSASVSCGHRVCNYCWTSMICNFIGRIKSVINESPASEWNLWLKCPYESCRVTGGRDMIQRFATDEEKSKYNRFLFISYVDDNKMMKCCPVPGRCTNNLSPDSESSKVLCQCLLTFCWNCCNDAHSPVDCETAAKWLAKIMSGYQNSNRLCRGDWTNHGEETCTNDAVMDIPYEETNSQWETEECYENWQSNDLLMQKAKVKLQQLRSVDIPKLSKIQLPTEQQLEFIKEAGLQVIESRRILKWTYAYQYYLPDDNKQNLLKICQGNVKLLLKALDKCIETKLPGFLNAEGVSEKFNAFRFKLTRLTRTTREYNEKLMIELEAGLANDVSASGMPQMAYNSDQTSGSGLNHDE